jgi:hypothetical protein
MYSFGLPQLRQLWTSEFVITVSYSWLYYKAFYTVKTAKKEIPLF